MPEVGANYMGKLHRKAEDSTRWETCATQRQNTPLASISAEGGNRTHMPDGHTILSRARLPVPPLRRVSRPSIHAGVCVLCELQTQAPFFALAYATSAWG